MFQRWDICRAYVEYEEKSGGKRRPVLVINVGIDTFISFKITKNISRDDDLEYKIIKWQDAGLDCPSCVRLGHKVYFSTLDHLVKLGRLQKIDIDNIKTLCQKYDIKLNEDLNMGKIDWDKVQYGVHQFSTGSIIFIGTAEECGKYIDDRPELWADAEVCFMTPDDPHYIKEWDEQELEESVRNFPYGYKDAMKVLNGKAPAYYYHLKEIEMDSGDGTKLANYAKKLGLNVIQDPDSDPDYPIWYIPGEYHWDDYFYPYPYTHEYNIDADKKEQGLKEKLSSEAAFSKGYIDKYSHLFSDFDALIKKLYKYLNIENNDKLKSEIEQHKNTLKIGVHVLDFISDNGEAKTYEDQQVAIDKLKAIIESLGYTVLRTRWAQSGSKRFGQIVPYVIFYIDFKKDSDNQELEETIEDKTYAVTVKYHNEPNAKIEARSAKDRKDLEYQLNMADEVEWYDFDEEQFTESLDQMREKALKMKENSNAFAILYGYRFKDKEVELEPEEFATEKEYKDRIQQITNSFTKLSDKDPRGNRHGKEHNIEFYTVYPNKKQVSESTAINNNWKVKKSRIDTKKIDSIINNLISSFPIIGSKPATIFKRHYKEKFVRYDIWLGYAVPGDAEAVEQKLLPSFEYLRDAVAPYGWKAFFEFSGYVGTDFFIQIRMPYETLENIAPIVVTESISYSDKNTNKWNIGSDKSNLTSGEIALLDELAQKLEVNSPNGYKYVVQSTYEDFGANMQWYTIVCYDKRGNSWQVLNTKDWLQLMNTGDVDAVYDDVVNDKYFQDKESYSPFKALDNLDD